MALRSKTVRALFCTILIGCFTIGALADTLRLRDGSIIKGRIVSFQDGKFVVAIGEGSRRREMTFLANEIQSIVFDNTSQTVANRTAVYTDSTPAAVPPKVVTTDNVESKPVLRPPVDQPGNSSSDSVVKPIAWSVKVLADNTANGWTNTGWVLKKGQRVRISADGTVSLGKGKSSTPSGNSDLNDVQKLLKNVPAGALIAVIGDDNNDFIYIGAERTITATRDGALFLGINENDLDDNTGAYSAKVEVIPGT